MALVDHVLGVFDLRLTVVQLQLGAVTDDQHALVAQADIADQLAAVFGLVEVRFVGFGLHARLTQNHVAGQGGNLLLLLEAGGFGRDEHR